jgi:hypothetical protein
MEAELGKWYYGVKCLYCGTLSAVELAPDPWQAPVTEYSPETEVRCDCGHHRKYSRKEFFRYQHVKT